MPTRIVVRKLSALKQDFTDKIVINDDPTPTSVVCLLTSNSAGMAIMQSSKKNSKYLFVKKKKFCRRGFTSTVPP